MPHPVIQRVAISFSSTFSEVNGPLAFETLADVAAQTGEPDRAIAALQKVLSIPGGTPLTPALLRLDPTWDPLRNDPRFQKLCQGVAK